MTEKKQNKIERVSRWFALGLKSQRAGLDRTMLHTLKAKSAWQKGQAELGFDYGVEEESAHIQLWLVTGSCSTLEDVEGKIKKAVAV